jgi:hypothetical protein
MGVLAQGPPPRWSKPPTRSVASCAAHCLRLVRVLDDQVRPDAVRISVGNGWDVLAFGPGEFPQLARSGESA